MQGGNAGLRKLLDQLIAAGRECEWLEFKESHFDRNYLGKCISALANSSLLLGKERAYVVFGVRNSSLEVVGTRISLAQQKVGNEEIENWLHNRLRPGVDFKFHEFSYDSKKVIMVEVDPAYDRPVTFDNVPYIRVGSYTKNLRDHPEKERKIWMLADKLGFEKQVARMKLAEGDVFALLDCEQYFALRGQRLPSDTRSSLQRLVEENLVLATDTLGITNMGALLFAKDLRKFDRLARKTVRIVLYSGRGRLETIREIEVCRGYASGFEDLIERLESQLPAKEEIGSDGFRKSIAYPSVAIREIVANLLIHQDFSISGAGPMIEIFSDRVEFTNPGESLVDKMRVIDSAPQSRNEMLARFMRMVRLCEERGSGIDKVIHAVEQAQLPPPKFIAEKNYFRVILSAPKKFKAMSKEERINACYQHCCLRYVSGDVMTNGSLRERFGIAKKNYPMAHRIITDTIAEALVKRDPAAGEAKRKVSYIPTWA